MNIFKKPLKKSHNEKISGVCAGLAKSLEIDVSWVRLFFVLFGLYGAGLAAYIILAIVLEYDDEESTSNIKSNNKDTLNMEK